MNVKKILLPTFVTFAAFGLAACDQITTVDPDLSPEQVAELEAEESDSSSTQESQVEPRDYMGMTFPMAFHSINPTHVNSTYTARMVNMVGEGLYRKRTDGSIVDGVVAGPGEEVEANVYHFPLKDQAQWSDGEPVVAQDFVLAWRQLVDPAQENPYGDLLNQVVVNAQAIQAGEASLDDLGVQALSETVLAVELEADHDLSQVEELFAFPATYPLPSHLLEGDEQVDQYGGGSNQLVFNGPYTLSGWQSGWDAWTFAKNPFYWNADQYPTENILAQVVGDAETSVENYQRNLVDLAYYYPQAPDNFSEVLFIQTNQYQAQEEVATPFANPVLAESILGAVNVDQVVEESRFSLQPAQSLSLTQAYEPDEVDEAQLNQDFLQELDRIGYDALELDLVIPDTDLHQDLAHLIKGQIESTLDKIVINILPDGNHRITERIDNQAYDFTVRLLGNWTNEESEIYHLYAPFLSNSPANRSSFSDPSYDKIFTEYTYNQMIPSNTIQAADHLLQENSVVKPLAYVSHAYQVSSTVQPTRALEGIQVNPQFDFQAVEFIQTEDSIPQLTEEVE